METTPSRDAAVQALLDKEAIREVLRCYAYAVDQRDLDTVASCFLPNAEYQGSLGTGHIGEALVAMRERIARYRSTMHLLANQHIDLHHDTATSNTYSIIYHRFMDEPCNLTVGVRYEDALVRTNDVWRIARRVVHQEWQRYDDLLPTEETP